MEQICKIRASSCPQPTIYGAELGNSIDVLRWIQEGCPDGRWRDFTYKTAALALQNRRLVTISKCAGTWRATIRPARTSYLEHGGYPASHFPKQHRREHSAIPVSPTVVSEGVEAGAGEPVSRGAITARLAISDTASCAHRRSEKRISRLRR
jgi:hypothetical protein